MTDLASYAALAGLEAAHVLCLAHRAEAERVHQHALARLALLHPERHAVEAADRALVRHARRVRPRRPRLGARVPHDLDEEAVGVAEGEHALGHRTERSRGERLVRHAVAQQPLHPLADGCRLACLELAAAARAKARAS